MTRTTNHVLVVLLLVFICACNPGQTSGTMTISVVGTADVHGALVPKNDAGGLDVFAGYIDNLREFQAANGGAVIILDAGDMWQGTLESNLTEGASVVEAYNIIGYTAAAIGNHDFDFGPDGPNSVPASDEDDPRGALKSRASEAQFPLLGSNIIDERSGQPVNWPNVSPTTMIEIDGIRIGIIGATTENTLATTIADNTHGIAIAPLVETFVRFGEQLRADGADIVLVTVHAGGRCTEFEDPNDVTSCNPDTEIFRVANALPDGLVDLIVAGHTHQGIAHFVNGIPIVSAFSSGRAFGRVDLTWDRGTASITARTIFPPQLVCEFVDSESGECAANTEDAVPAHYADKAIVVDPALEQAIETAAAAVRDFKERPLGVSLAAEMKRSPNPDSAIGNLLTTALLEMSDGADVAIHNTVGGIRADLPAGPLTFGDVFEVFPFDNRSVTISLTGAELRAVFKSQLTRTHRRAGVAGIKVAAACENDSLRVRLLRPDGIEIEDTDILTVATNDFLVAGGDGIFVPVTPPEGLDVGGKAELFREQIATWLLERGGTIDPDDFHSIDEPVFILPGKTPISCQSAGQT